MIIGPAFNFALLKIDFKIGPYELNNLSGPGFLLALIWLLIEILTTFFYKNLKEFSQNDERPNEHTPINKSDEDAENNYGSSNEINNKSSLSSSQTSEIRIIDNSETIPIWLKLYDEYVKEEVIAVFAATFSAFFMQTCVETLVTPLFLDFFNWKETENSIFFGIAGFVVNIIYIHYSFTT
jgi:MFS transporter, ceroid-lipofuscinosis neuronal protein 7